MKHPRRRIWRELPTLLAASLLAAITLVAVVALIRMPNDPALRIATALQSPSLGMPLGADQIGRDLFSRILQGATWLWLPSLAVVLISASFGSLVGTIGGSAGGWVDMALDRFTSLFRAIPAAIAAIAATEVFGGPFTAALALALFWWPWYARLARAEMHRQRVLPHMQAARLSGHGAVTRILRHMLPAVMPGIVVSATLDLAQVVLVLALISFLGLSRPEPAADLGAMAAQGLDWLADAWWLAGAPIGAVFVLALAANIAGEVFRARFARR